MSDDPMSNDKTARKPFEPPRISPATDLEESRKSYPIMGFIGAGSGLVTDGDGLDGTPDGLDGGPGDSLGDNPVEDGGTNDTGSE